MRHGGPRSYHFHFQGNWDIDNQQCGTDYLVTFGPYSVNSLSAGDGYGGS